MMRTLSFLLAALAALSSSCSDRAKAPASPRGTLRSQNSGLGTVESVEPVRVSEGFKLWRNGQEVTFHDGLLIRLRDVNPLDFYPQNITPPLFVLGDAVADELASPFSSKETILLTWAPPPDTDVPLWLTPKGTLPDLLVGPTLTQLQTQAIAATATSGLTIHTPPASTPQTVYNTLDDVLYAVTPLRASPEVCALVGKGCGLVPQSRFGPIDCGPCLTGQVCTSENQCCWPTTCYERAFTCGTLDSCGTTLNCGTCVIGVEECVDHRCMAICPAGHYRCCDDSCSPTKSCPGVACDPGGDEDE
jgi:hypothetical protein